MEILEKVKNNLPTKSISRIELEGSEIIVYTKDRDFFLKYEEDVRKAVEQLKKRIEIRPENNLSLDQEATKKKIIEIVPEEARIKDIYFEPERSLVIIAAEKPGLVIGKGGETFRKIRNETFWVPRIERVPSIKSDVIESIRKVIHTEVKFRKEFLNKIGESIFTERKTNRDWIRLIALGGFREVGRSCILVETPKSKVLIDCGVNVGGTNGSVYPILSTKEFDYNELDAIIVSHSHLDHLGFVPALYEYGYNGPVYLTTPTVDLATLLWLDFIDVMQRNAVNPLFTAKGVKEAVKHSVPLEYGEVSDVAPDVRLTFQNAGHILGCVKYDTLVVLADGTITEIKNLCNPHPKIVETKSMDENLNIVNSKAIVFKKENKENLYEIETSVGNLTVTPEHPFFILDENGVKEILAKDVEKNMFLAAPRKIYVKGEDQKLGDFPKSKAHNSIHIVPPKIVTGDLAQLVGYLLGDGSKSWTGRKKSSGILILNDENLDLLYYYKNMIEDIFKFFRKPKIYLASKKGSSGKSLRINCSELVRFFEVIFPKLLVHSTERKIPEIITRCKNKEVARFLRGLFDAEGSVHVENGNIELTMNNKNIVYGAMLLLLRFGILSNVKERKNYGFGNKCYRLTITDRESIEIFFNLIGFDHPKKKDKLQKLINKPKHPFTKTHKITIPKLLKSLRYVRKKMKMRREDFPVSIKHYEEGHGISYPLFKKLINIFEEKLKRLEKYYHSEIKSWEKIGKILDEIKASKKELAKLIGVDEKSIYNWTKNKCKPRFEKLTIAIDFVKKELEDILYDPKLRGNISLFKKLAENQVRWVEIKDIKKIKGDEEVYDLYVPKHHSFISNGIISHNSSLIHLHIGEGLHNIVYASDMKFGRTTLLDPAFTDFQRVETLIIESTYGGSEDIMPPRQQAEKQLMEVINKTMERNGMVLIPSFAVERAQDVMAILVENNFQYPVFIDGMIWDATGIYTAYPEYMNRNVQRKIFNNRDPFKSEIFKRVASISDREKVWEEKPCVIISTSGMLTGGPVIEHLKALAEDSKNTLIFVGYQAEGTFGRRIQKGWKEIPFKTENGKTVSINLNMEVQTIDGLSGHSDRNQLLSFVHHLSAKPDKVIICHGENQKAVDLARTIHKLFRIETVAPRNLESIRLK